MVDSELELGSKSESKLKSKTKSTSALIHVICCSVLLLVVVGWGWHRFSRSHFTVLFSAPSNARSDSVSIETLTPDPNYDFSSFTASSSTSAASQLHSWRMLSTSPSRGDVDVNQLSGPTSPELTKALENSCIAAGYKRSKQSDKVSLVNGEKSTLPHASKLPPPDSNSIPGPPSSSTSDPTSTPTSTPTPTRPAESHPSDSPLAQDEIPDLVSKKPSFLPATVSQSPRRRVFASVVVRSRDRSWLLLEYLKELVRRNLLDEIHLWDATQTEADTNWLQSFRAPLIHTPNVQTKYHSKMTVKNYCPSLKKGKFVFQVATLHDVHVRLSTTDAGRQFYFVLGGWTGRLTVFKEKDGDVLRDPSVKLNVHITPLALPLSRNLTLEWGDGYLLINSPGNKEWKVDFNLEVESIDFMTGFSSSGMWNLESLCDTVLSDQTPFRYAALKPTDLPNMMEYYKHYYTLRNGYYKHSVILRMDESISYIDVDQFENFLDQISNPGDNAAPFLIFPHQINGTQEGLANHAAFLENPVKYRSQLSSSSDCESISADRLMRSSFYAITNEMLQYYNLMLLRAKDDDESVLTQKIPSRLKLQKSLCSQFIVAQTPLSALPNDANDDATSLSALLRRYSSLYINIRSGTGGSWIDWATLDHPKFGKRSPALQPVELALQPANFK